MGFGGLLWPHLHMFQERLKKTYVHFDLGSLYGLVHTPRLKSKILCTLCSSVRNSSAFWLRPFARHGDLIEKWRAPLSLRCRPPPSWNLIKRTESSKKILDRLQMCLSKRSDSQGRNPSIYLTIHFNNLAEFSPSPLKGSPAIRPYLQSDSRGMPGDPENESKYWKLK